MNRRQRKKQATKIQKVEQLKAVNYDISNNASKATVDKLYKQVTKRSKRKRRVSKVDIKPNTAQIKADNAKAKRALRREQLKAEKLEYLLSHGIDRQDIKQSQLSKSWDYIKSLTNIFDLRKPFTFKDNQRMYIAFRDYSGERSFQEILNEVSNLSDDELLNRLDSLVNTPPSYTGRGSGSSGSAGDFKMMFATQEVISVFNQETYNENRKSSKRSHKWQHTGDHKGYQVLKSGGRNSFDTATPRKLLEVSTAIMGNVTEMDRTAFYSNFYAQMNRHNPDFANILPKPKF